MTDFCGFYEMALSVLKFCTETQEAERQQLEASHRAAEIRPEAWRNFSSTIQRHLETKFQGNFNEILFPFHFFPIFIFIFKLLPI